LFQKHNQCHILTDPLSQGGEDLSSNMINDLKLHLLVNLIRFFFRICLLCYYFIYELGQWSVLLYLKNPNFIRRSSAAAVHHHGVTWTHTLPASTKLPKSPFDVNFVVNMFFSSLSLNNVEFFYIATNLVAQALVFCTVFKKIEAWASIHLIPLINQ
jgi:hypothetical protein